MTRFLDLDYPPQATIERLDNYRRFEAALRDKPAILDSLRASVNAAMLSQALRFAQQVTYVVPTGCAIRVNDREFYGAWDGRFDVPESPEFAAWYEAHAPGYDDPPDPRSRDRAVWDAALACATQTARRAIQPGCSVMDVIGAVQSVANEVIP